jgi:hypothetical protein
MSREVHVRICEGVGVRFPHATRLLYSTVYRFFYHPLVRMHIRLWPFTITPDNPGVANRGLRSV